MTDILGTKNNVGTAESVGWIQFSPWYQGEILLLLLAVITEVFLILVCKVKANWFFIQLFTNFTKKPGTLTEHASVFNISVETSC